MKDISQRTRALDKAGNYGLMADKKLKEMGKVPYGQVPATPKEQRDAYNKLTYPELQELREKHGVVELQKYVKTMRGK